MTNTELINKLKTLEGVSVYSVRATLGATLPYLVVTFGQTDNFVSDNRVTVKKQAISLELYTEVKDETTEAKVEKLLDDNDIPWDKDEAYDDGEQFYINYYDITRR